jgi:hypothetical protein
VIKPIAPTSFGDDAADAALFYGRSREIADVLEELRKVRAERDLRPFVILGASGAGKSSLLRAGIIPRLRREAPAWLPLRAFRPVADPLLNFAEALARTLSDFGKVEAHGAIRDRLLAIWSKAEREDNELTPAGRAALEVALEAEGRKLRASTDRDGATILISVDQAEELVRAKGDGAEALADYLQAALASTTGSLAACVHHPHRELPRAAKASPLSEFESARLRPACSAGVSASRAWSRSRRNATALSSTSSWSPRSTTMRRRKTRCPCWHSRCSGCGAAMPPRAPYRRTVITASAVSRS